MGGEVGAERARPGAGGGREISRAKGLGAPVSRQTDPGSWREGLGAQPWHLTSRWTPFEEQTHSKDKIWGKQQ